MAVVLTGCSTLDVLTDKENAIPESVLMTKPLQVDLEPDLRVGVTAPTPRLPVKTAIAPSRAALGTGTPARNGLEGQYRCGNEPVYTLNGRSYKVLPSANGYRAQGMASRYSAKYQGSVTAGCEKYDLHAFTAAHRTLPLPSFVRVTNVQNNKMVIVKVNDRGPFDSDGLIQLSSAAAGILGMSEQGGNAQVRVEAVSARGGVAGAKPVIRQQQAVANTSTAPAGRAAVRRPPPVMRPAVKRPQSAQSAAVQKAKQSGKSFFVIVKNYPSQADALDMFVRLTSVGLKRTELASAVNKGRKVHQVRVGPLYTQDQIDSVKDTLSGNGLATFRVVEVGL